MSELTHEIHLLGGIQVIAAGRTISRFRTQKTGALLAYLALSPGLERQREELVELFWPESDFESGRMSLRTCLAALRRDLEDGGRATEDVLIASRTTVSLNPDRVTSDVQQFESTLRAASAAGKEDRPAALAALQSATSLYRGPLAPGVYQDWAVTERNRLETLYVGALRDLAEALADEGRVAEAVERMRKAISLDPLREELHAGIMRLYHASGQTGAAIRQYHELEKRLREELSAAPSPQTRSLLDELRSAPTSASGSIGTPPVPADREAADPTLLAETPAAPAAEPGPALAAPPAESRRPAAARLPLQLTRFFGREDELDSLVRLLSPDPAGSMSHRLVTLTGPAGCGKTRLAVEVARRLAATYQDAVWFVSMAEATNAQAIPSSICQALGTPAAAGEIPLDKAAAALNRDPSLLVLDNLEHIAEEGAGMVWELLSKAPNLTCLTTSRQRLGLGGEQEIALGPLQVPAAAAPPELLMQYPSVSLWVDRARAVRPDFELNRSNAPAVAALCERLEGLPLALELAAAWSQTLTPAQILSRLSQRFDLLKSQRRDLAPRHRTLRAAVEWSYNLLDPAVRKLFARLSVFRGGFRLEAAEAVCDEPAALEFLGLLRECSLVLADELGDAMRFRLLETLRDFAAEQLEPADKESAAALHLAHYSALAEESDGRLHGPDQKLWSERLAEEHDNFRAALDWCAANPDRLVAGLDLAGHLYFFWQVRGYVPEGFRWLTRFLKMAEASSLISDGSADEKTMETLERAYRGAGELAYAQGRRDQARLYLERSLPMSRSRKYLAGVAFCLTYLGLMDTRDGDLERGRTRLEEALAIWKEPRDEGGIAHVLNCLGINALARGDVRGSFAHFDEALEIYRRVGNRRGMAMVLGESAVAALEQGDYFRATSLLSEQLQLAREVKDMGHMSLALTHLGLAMRRQGKWTEARSYYEQSLALAREMGQRHVSSVALRDLGEVLLEIGETTLARAHLEESHRQARELGDTRIEASVTALMVRASHPNDAGL